MRTRERLKAIQKWAYENLCKGREMKAPGLDEDMHIDLTKFTRQEPKVYLGWWPSRPDETNFPNSDYQNISPGILIAPAPSEAKNMEEKRFDRYSHISRPQALGQSLCVSILFSVFEPGTRLPGFVKNNGYVDMTKFAEGTEEGLFTLTNWMDDSLAHLLAVKSIPESDLFLDESSVTYSLYSDSGYVVDKRPFYYGFINAKFNCYATEHPNSTIEDYLK